MLMEGRGVTQPVLEAIAISNIINIRYEEDHIAEKVLPSCSRACVWSPWEMGGWYQWRRWN